jgi:predicted secreted Zn-dependent protease
MLRMKKYKILVSLLAIPTLSLGNTNYKFPITKSYETYTVTGNSFIEIDNSFESSKPNWIFEKGFDAYTNVNYKYSIDDYDCSIDYYNVNIIYTLPQLSVSNTNLKNEYKSYLYELYRHEEIHCAITLEILDKIYKLTLLGQQNEDKCQAIQQESLELEKLIDTANEKFDLETNHGEFPNRYSMGKTQYLKICKIEIKPII